MPGKGGRRGKCGKYNRLPPEYYISSFRLESILSLRSFPRPERKRKKKHIHDISEEKPEHVTCSTLLNYRFAPRPVSTARLSVPMIHPRGMEILYLFARLSLHIYHTSSRRNVD